MRLHALCLGWILWSAAAGPAREWSGQVVDSDGRTVAGARLLVILSGQQAAEPLLQTVSAADGSYSFSIADDQPALRGYSLCLVIASGLAIGGESLHRLSDDPRIVLETATPLEVEFHDPEGHPAAGLPVRVAFISRREQGLAPLLISLAAAYDPLLAGVTDAQGKVRFTQLPPRAAVRLEVDDDRFARSDEWRTTGAPGPPLKLQRAGTIRGRVTYETGEPAAGASLHYTDQTNEIRRTALTDADGRYEFKRLPPGVGVLLAAPPREQRHDWATAAAPVVELADFDPQAEVDLAFQRGVPLTITVLDNTTGQPASGLGVMVTGPQWPAGGWGGGASFWPLDAQGRVVIPVLPGEQTVHYGNRDSTGRYENQPYPPPTITVAAGEPQAVELRAKPRVVLPAYLGRVVDATGQPVGGATISSDQGDFLSELGQAVQSDAQGRFEVPNRGSQTASVSAFKGDAATISPTILEPGVEATLTLQANARASIRVVVEDATGQPLEGAQVRLFRWADSFGSQRGTATTDKAGSATLSCWPHGAYSLQVDRPGFGQVNSERFAVGPGEQVDQGPFVLPKAEAVVAGWVIGEDGQPVAGITVQINGAPHGFRRTTTNARGEFRFENIVDAPVPLQAYSSDTRLQGFATAKPNDENTVLSVKRAR